MSKRVHMRALVASAILLCLGATSTSVRASESWRSSPGALESLAMSPIRESGRSLDGLRLALKRYPRDGAQPVLLVHGLAQNDRGWDPTVRQYSFARFLHAQGFDVWVGNMRDAGTAGFRSETPPGPHHWTIDDYASFDVPGLIEAVRKKTGQPPFVIGHSLAAWALEGYLAGVSYDSRGRVVPNPRLAAERQAGLKGVVTIAGVYNIRWEHGLAQARENPVLDLVDFYHSNYELELVASSEAFYRIVPRLRALPLGWLGALLNLPLERLPWVGSPLRALYQGLQLDVIRAPVFNMLYYPPGVDAELVRSHVRDGLEDLGPRLLEQLANAIRDRATSSYYHLSRPEGAYEYGSAFRRVGAERLEVPLLFVGGGRDRLASALEVYEDGYVRTQARDKQYLQAEAFGHMDILSGIHAPEEVMAPVVHWMRQRM